MKTRAKHGAKRTKESRPIALLATLMREIPPDQWVTTPLPAADGKVGASRIFGPTIQPSPKPVPHGNRGQLARQGPPPDGDGRYAGQLGNPAVG
jgi:hypothetical protein